MICLPRPAYVQAADFRTAQAHATQYLLISVSSAFLPRCFGCFRMDDADLHKFGWLRIDVAALREFGCLRMDVAVLREFGCFRMDVAVLREFGCLPMDVSVLRELGCSRMNLVLLRQFGWLIDVDLQILGEAVKNLNSLSGQEQPRPQDFFLKFLKGHPFIKMQ